MTRPTPAWSAALAAGTCLLLATSAQAAPSPPAPAPSSPSSEDPKLAEAKELFKQGLALQKAGDTERALELFLESRAASASVPNTLNAAVCLRDLGRFDEALGLYEELVAKMQSELSADERKTVTDEMAALRQKVGSIEVVSNVAGTLVVGGRARGQLPLVGPLRVLPGKHVLTVIKEGYQSAEVTVEVTAGATTTAELRLEPLPSAPTAPVAPPPRQDDVAGETSDDESGAGSAWLDLFGGLAMAPSFGSGAEASCESADCSSNPVGLGLLVGIRGGWEFPIRLSIEIAAGYFRAAKTLERAIPSALANGDAVTFSFTDELSVSGPFAGAGLGYRLPFADVMELRAHLLAGALFAFSNDDISGSVADGSGSMGVSVTGSGQSVSSADLFVMPSLGLGASFEGVRFGLELNGVLYALGGPESKKDFAQATESCGSTPTALACRYSDSAVVKGEQAYGTFFVFVPSAYVGYSF